MKGKDADESETAKLNNVGSLMTYHTKFTVTLSEADLSWLSEPDYRV